LSEEVMTHRSPRLRREHGQDWRDNICKRRFPKLKRPWMSVWCRCEHGCWKMRCKWVGAPRETGFDRPTHHAVQQCQSVRAVWQLSRIPRNDSPCSRSL